jgi:hypothetical protein
MARTTWNYISAPVALENLIIILFTVFLVVKHDNRGVFQLDGLTSYREFSGYIVGNGYSTARLFLENYQCGDIYVTVRMNTEYISLQFDQASVTT